MKGRAGNPDREAALLAEVKALGTMSRRLQHGLTLLSRMLEAGVQADSITPLHAALHLKEHRRGRPSKIVCDPELETFIIERMTFQQIAEDIARHFPPQCHVSCSSIHRWFRRWRQR